MSGKRAKRAVPRARRLRGLALVTALVGLLSAGVLLVGSGEPAVRTASAPSKESHLAAIALVVLSLLPAAFLYATARWRECARELALRVVPPGAVGKERRAKLRAAVGAHGRGLETSGALLLVVAALAVAVIASSNAWRAVGIGALAWLPGALAIVLGRWRALSRALRRLDGGACETAGAAPRVPPKSASHARWFAPGEPCTVAGFSISGGMLYVGGDLASIADPAQPEAALVDPELAVERGDPDRSAARARSAKSYAALPPASRAAYLEWLAGGRRDAAAPAPYLALFLFGLERRLCVDGDAGLVTPAEALALERELRRLASLYEGQRAFRRAAQRLADFAAVRFLAERELDPPPLDADVEEGAPARLWLGLGRFAQRGEALPAPWARAWLALASEEALPSSARRAPEEFEALFRARLPSDFGSDLAKRAQRVGVFARCEPSSPSLAGRRFEARAELPDLSRLRKPVQELAELARACGEELEPWARWRARHAEERPDLAALALLPRELLARRDDPPLEATRALVERALADERVATIDERELLRPWPELAGKLGARDGANLARLLAKLGAGLEPDARFGGPRLGAGGRCALFRLTPDAPHAPSRAYSAATLVLHLATLVSAADGEASEPELARLERMLDEHLELGPAERDRLRAHRAWLVSRPLELRGLKKRVEALELAERERIARFLIEVARADGRVDAAEVRMLERLYALLALDPASVHRDLHAAGVAQDDEPVRVRAAEPRPGGVAIPPQRAGIELDGALVRRKLAETAKVSALLADIFAGDGEDGEAAEAARGESTGEEVPSCVAGLDAPHSAFFRALGERASWPRAEVEELAERFGLLPDGALDTLNDASLERCDVPLWEGEDPIEVDRTAVEELLR